ncbi:hypothetical protein [Labrys neptuniae]
MIHHPIHDDPDVKASLNELRELKQQRQMFRRLKGYDPPDHMDVSTLKQQNEEARRAAMKK